MHVWVLCMFVCVCGCMCMHVDTQSCHQMPFTISPIYLWGHLGTSLGKPQLAFPRKLCVEGTDGSLVIKRKKMCLCQETSHRSDNLPDCFLRRDRSWAVTGQEWVRPRLDQYSLLMCASCLPETETSGQDPKTDFSSRG